MVLWTEWRAIASPMKKMAATTRKMTIAGSSHIPGDTGCPAVGGSGGIPRLVNAVCDKALLAGFVERSPRINYRMISRAIRELEGDIHA